MAEKKEFKITDLPGVGAATAEKLEEAGFNTLMSIAVASHADMVEIAGVTEATARKIINNASSIYLLPINDLPEKRFDLIHNVIVRASLFATKYALPYLN